MNLLDAEKIKVSFGIHEVIKGIDLSLKEGEVVGLIGPNGAGKSTLMKALAQVVPYQAGMIKFKGKDLKRFKAEERARRIAYMPQGSLVYWPLRVFTMVSLGRLPHLAPWARMTDPDYQAVYQAMEETDVRHLADRTVNHLAGGERLLVMLARALAVEPDLLLADEPVSGLDPYHQIQVMELLNELAVKRGCGMMLVLHDLTLAARFCQRLILIHQGKVLAHGRPREVLSAENLRQGYRIEARYQTQTDPPFVIPWKRLDSV